VLRLPGEDVNAGQSHWDQAHVILADTVMKHLLVNSDGSQLFVYHSALEANVDVALKGSICVERSAF
jgi:hypothetical protein